MERARSKTRETGARMTVVVWMEIIGPRVKGIGFKRQESKALNAEGAKAKDKVRKGKQSESKALGNKGETRIPG